LIGLLLLGVAVTILVLLLYLEIVSSASWGFPFQKIGSKVSESDNLNLILYEIVAILWLIGFPLFVQESQHPFLLEAFPTIWNQLMVGLISVFGVPLWNAARYGRLATGEDDAMHSPLEEGDVRGGRYVSGPDIYLRRVEYDYMNQSRSTIIESLRALVEESHNIEDARAALQTLLKCEDDLGELTREVVSSCS